MEIAKGSKVQVFNDPIECKNADGVATVTKVIHANGYDDAEGNPVFRCKVRYAADEFGGNAGLYERDVSRLA